MSDFLEVKWVNTHNLKNIDIKIPKNKLTVITWLSWSWKSSLAFKTIYNIWQQKYLESLSTYARMFIWWVWEEAKYREISGLSPTISIDQKTTNRNPRSTVWTITEIYDYLKLIFLNLWDRKCVKCWSEIKKDSIQSIIDSILTYQINTKFIIKTEILKWKLKNLESIKKEVLNLWFIRFAIWNKIYSINDEIENIEILDNVFVVIDRLIVKDFQESDLKRLKDSIDLWLKISSWFLSIDFILNENNTETKNYSTVFVCNNCLHTPKELDISSFSFNSHSWACETCHWLWEKVVFLEERIINPRLTIAEWAILPWFWSNYYHELVLKVCKKHKIDSNISYIKLTKKQRDIILYWTWEDLYEISPENNMSWKKYISKYKWIINILNDKYYSSDVDNEKLWNYISTIDCPECNWYRLNKESLSVYFRWKNIWDLSILPVSELYDFFDKIILNESEEKIVKNIFKNIKERLEFLSWVWLSYISLSRKSATLSGWESQRIRLATQIWTKLEWIIYVLDEPSIWLHPRDNDMLIENLKKLKNIWNTLIVVEHDEDIMKNADYIIDIWPWAWIYGWEVIFSWIYEEILKSNQTTTWKYLSNQIPRLIKKEKRFINNYLEIFKAKQNNLKNIDVKIPLNNLVVICWPSWSWKSSLVNYILSPYLLNELNWATRQVGQFEKITWLQYIDKVIVVDQSPIWKTPRSNPATYTWVFDHIRALFAETIDAKTRWYWPWRFSFNTRDWRCNHCDWDWVKKIEMHFLPPVYVKCEYCDGKRFNNETLEIKFKWKSISDVLDMTIVEAMEFFKSQNKIFKILEILNQVWLGYIKLWQSSTTLSGWESQRIKLATELSKRSTSKTFYILDEPTTWLHFEDTQKLLKILNSLVEKWNSVLVIEHNMDIIANRDYIIDFWPTGWDKWWYIVASWTVEEVISNKKSITWEYIKKYLENTI